MTEGVPPQRRRASDRSPIENALRYIGSQRSGQLVELLETALVWPRGDIGVALLPLTEPTLILAEWTASERAEVLELLIKAGVEHPSVGPSEHSRERRVLRAAFRIPDPDIQANWAATLSDRWSQLRALEHVFPRVSTSTTQPMEAAWTRAVRNLEAYLSRSFQQLRTVADWQQIKQNGFYSRRDLNHNEPLAGSDLSELRPASEHAQPFFVDLIVVTVYMKERAIFRRSTERVVTAQSEGVEFYIARSYTGKDVATRAYVPIQALWGCTAESAPAGSFETRLRFPHPLQRGEQAYFASEALSSQDEPEGDREWINVEVDHHGIAKGRLHHNGLVPSSGLTIRVCFDDGWLPASAWYYAEATDYERHIEPPTGDGRLLDVIGGGVSHTFVQVGQPRENYGIGLRWNPE